MQYNYKMVVLFALFVIFSGLAVLLVFKPLRKSKVQIISAISIVLLVAFLYTIWGGWGDYYAFRMMQESKQNALKLLKDIKSPDEIREKLVKHLEKDPESARGWYLLGRLYVSQNNTKQALQAFARAYKLESQNVAIIVNYASLLLESGDASGQKMLEKLLDDDPKQQDALAILAMQAYRNNNLSVAVTYWQRLLDTLPPQSEEADTIRKAIAKVHDANI